MVCDLFSWQNGRRWRQLYTGRLYQRQEDGTPHSNKEQYENQGY